MKATPINAKSEDQRSPRQVGGIGMCTEMSKKRPMETWNKRYNNNCYPTTNKYKASRYN